MGKLYYFNPDTEMAIANGSPFYTPPANIVRMADELAYLPAYFSEQGDGIWMKQRPSPDFVESRLKIFNLSPRIFTEQETIPSDLKPEPWGWSPRMASLLQADRWKPEDKERYSRKIARNCLIALQRALPFVEASIFPTVCSSLEEIKDSLQDRKVYLVKAPWSSSGKGLLKIQGGEINVKSGEWIRGILDRQGYIMLEEFLDKECDFAMEFYAEKGKIRFLGLSLFYSGKNGEYKGNYIGEQEKIEQKLISYLGETSFVILKQQLESVLEIHIGSVYEGYFGVDMMIYKNRAGAHQIHPCVEINLRYTMGILALFLSQRYVLKNTEGLFTLTYLPADKAVWQRQLQFSRDYPLCLEFGKLKSGYIALTPVKTDTKFIADLQLTSCIPLKL